MASGDRTYRIIITPEAKQGLQEIVETKTEVRVIDISRSSRGPQYLEQVKKR